MGNYLFHDTFLALAIPKQALFCSFGLTDILHLLYIATLLTLFFHRIKNILKFVCILIKIIIPLLPSKNKKFKTHPIGLQSILVSKFAQHIIINL